MLQTKNDLSGLSPIWVIAVRVTRTAVTHDGDGVTSPRTAHVTRDGDDAMSPRTARSVRISRKDLRRMSDEEVSTRRSAVGNSTTATLPTGERTRVDVRVCVNACTCAHAHVLKDAMFL